MTAAWECFCWAETAFKGPVLTAVGKAKTAEWKEKSTVIPEASRDVQIVADSGDPRG